MLVFGPSNVWDGRAEAHQHLPISDLCLNVQFPNRSATWLTNWCRIMPYSEVSPSALGALARVTAGILLSLLAVTLAVEYGAGALVSRMISGQNATAAQKPPVNYRPITAGVTRTSHISGAQRGSPGHQMGGGVPMPRVVMPDPGHSGGAGPKRFP